MCNACKATPPQQEFELFSCGLLQTHVFISVGCTLLCHRLHVYSKKCFKSLAIHISTYPSMVSLNLTTAPCGTTVLSCGHQPCLLLRVVCSSLSERLHLLLHNAILAALQHTQTQILLCIWQTLNGLTAAISCLTPRNPDDLCFAIKDHQAILSQLKPNCMIVENE